MLFLFTLLATAILQADLSPNLEEMSQEYVLETKQIEIPGYSTACNPSVASWRDALLLSFNAYSDDANAKAISPDQMGLVWLDNDFHVISTPQILDVPSNLWQDARLLNMEGRLYLVFNGAIENGIRRMFVAQVHYDGLKFSLDTPECLLHFPGEQFNQWERNWVPFAYSNQLLLTYSVSPHRIFQPLLGTQTCTEISSTPFSGTWAWGNPKPGTSAYLDGDEYLSIFHSVKVMPTVHSKGESIQHYFMGAYTFENRPPFAITSISSQPIIGKQFYSGPDYLMTKPCRVVFPCGFVTDDQYIWVVFGKQDHEAWVTKLDKKGLYQSLVPIESTSK